MFVPSWADILNFKDAWFSNVEDRQADFDSQSEGGDVTASSSDDDHDDYDYDDYDEDDERDEGEGGVDYEHDEGEVNYEHNEGEVDYECNDGGGRNPLKRPRASTESNAPTAKKDKSDPSAGSPPPFLPSLDGLEFNRPKIGKGPWVDRLLLPEMEDELDLYATQFVGEDEQQLARIKEQRQRVKESVLRAAKQAYSVDVDFKKAMTPKDRVNPKSGKTHAPGRSYKTLERFLPKLAQRQKTALDAQMADLRPAKNKNTDPGPPLANPPLANPPLANPGPPPAPTSERSNLEKLLDKYMPLQMDNGGLIEDKYGVLLFGLFKIPPPEQANLNVQMTEAAEQFTGVFQPTKSSKFRDQFKRAATLFTSMACHFAVWWAIGQQKRPPTFSSDMKEETNLAAWFAFFQAVEPLLHIINHVADCVDFFTMRHYRKLKYRLVHQSKRLPGSFMGIHVSHWANIAVHANQLPSKPHKDGLSSHLGFDAICSFGRFKNCWICFPHLGVRIRLQEFDVCLLRGAALYHHMYRWEGDGRFVIVPFADRHLFPTFRVGRPKLPSRIFGPDWKEFRNLYPATPLPAFA